MVILPPFYPEIIKSCIDQEIQTQIAGFDITVREILQPEDGGILDFNNSQRKIPDYKIINLHDDCWDLEPGGYIVRYNEIVEVPMDAIGILLPRSSLMRIGASISSAVWDPGYKGRGMGLLFSSRKIKIFKGARIAQIIFLKTLKSVKNGYSGNFQNEGL